MKPMTQEEIVREIAWKAWKDAANAHRLYPENKHMFTEYWAVAKEQFKEYIFYYEKLQSQSQQPIPQDINKWIEDEAEKIPLLKDLDAYHYPNHAVNVIKLSYWKDGAARLLEFLLPELQQLREENAEYCRNLHNCVDNSSKLVNEIYQQAKEIEQQKSQIEELNCKFETSLALNKTLYAEIESLKQENVKLKKELKNCADAFDNISSMGHP